ncbi:hypothetical protein Leryth_023618 [Lithospermum erythrorhizon]|nr:hypothetical protein Leryth_023618 [Lithospermum erythrorhizon]
MQTLRSVRQRHKNPLSSTTTTSFFTTTTAATSPILHQNSLQNPFFNKPSTTQFTSRDKVSNISTNDIVSSFKAWFLARNDPFLEQIFHILRTQEGFNLESSLSQLNLFVTERLVLQVLNYRKNSPDVLSCLKFFDWAGRQKGFFHTRATFSAIFRILSKAKLMSIMLEFLGTFLKQRQPMVRFYSTLVIGYSVAGKPETALQMFGRMRFQGIDLDSFGYNVLLNALVDEGHDDAFEMVVKQIRLRGLENPITHSIVTKSFCKKREFDKAEEYLRRLWGEGERLSGAGIAEFIDALCQDRQFKRAANLVEDLKKSNNIAMRPVYGVWLRYLMKAGKLGGALEFLKDKKIVDNYSADIFSYNTLVYKLIRDNRLEEVFDLLTEMREQHILPDELTMNSTLSFFCKAGMVDVAMELYESREEFGMSVSRITYNYLINALVGDVSVDEAYRVLAAAVDQGFSLGEKTISIIADALCREGKHEKLRNLALVALENKFRLKDSTYSKFISALCRARRPEDGYIIHMHLNRLNKVTSRMSYFNLIKGFNEATRGDIAARLLIEMQEKGHMANRWLFRIVISSLCLRENSEEQVLRLLQMQLTRHEPSTLIFNNFIDAAGKAKKPEISKKVYEIMRITGIQPNFRSHTIMLYSYLKNDKIVDALMFFRGLPDERRTSKRMWNGMIVGLCRVGRLDQALELFREMRANEIRPTKLCLEELVKLVCYKKKYSVVFSIIEDSALVGHRMSSFIGNVLLLNCLYSRKLFDAWVRSRNAENQTPSQLMLGKLIGAFSGCIDVSQDVEDMEELIKQCFTPDLYTYNMLLRRLIMTGIDEACDYINRIQEKGYEPNKWTYDALVHGYYKCGRSSEATKWRDVMLQKGFDFTECTKLLA